MKTILRTAAFGFALATLCLASSATASETASEVDGAIQRKAEQLSSLGTDPVVVAAVTAHNAHPSAEAAAMTNDAWKGLTVLDKFVRSLSKSELVDHLEKDADPAISELFISGADGTKVAFFAKTSSWSHKGNDKHELPMKGEIWIGSVEVDESTGVEQVQIGLPVIDGETVIGSLVIGVALDKIGS
jgi:hypothetical protein